jgi:hypothetical protein
MLKMPSIVLGVFVAMILGEAARAGTPITFEFRGVITQRDPFATFQVGDPFVSRVTFDPDAPDTAPQPDVGVYGILSFSVPTGRSTAPRVFGPGQAQIRVDVEGTNGWLVEHFGDADTGFNVHFNYPNGTFPTDALPRSLSLDNTSLRRLVSWDDGILIIGEVTSIVPEPTFSTGFCVAMLCALRRRNH